MILHVVIFLGLLVVSGLVLVLGLCAAADNGDRAMEQWFEAENEKQKAERGTA